MQQSESTNKKNGVSLGELIAASLVITAAILTFWKTTDVMLSALELKIQMNDKQNERIEGKMDKIIDDLNTIKISLQNKQDKK